MNIYEMLKEGKTVGQIYGIVANEISAARKMIDEEEAAKTRELKEARKNFINALEDYNVAITGKMFDREAREKLEKLEQLCIETEKEIAAIQHDLKEIEKLKKTPEKKPFVREKTCAVKFMPKDTDDEIIKNFIDKLI